MRALLIGAGRVGNTIVKIATRRSLYKSIVVTDYDLARAQQTINWVQNRHGGAVANKFRAIQIDTSDTTTVTTGAPNNQTMNAVRPKFVEPIFTEALTTSTDYLDADTLFSEISELGVRDGTNLVVRDQNGTEIFTPSFSIWTKIKNAQTRR